MQSIELIKQAQSSLSDAADSAGNENLFDTVYFTGSAITNAVLAVYEKLDSIEDKLNDISEKLDDK
jgi:hypothetical protein